MHYALCFRYRMNFHVWGGKCTFVVLHIFFNNNRNTKLTPSPRQKKGHQFGTQVRASVVGPWAREGQKVESPFPKRFNPLGCGAMQNACCAELTCTPMVLKSGRIHVTFSQDRLEVYIKQMVNQIHWKFCFDRGSFWSQERRLRRG